MNARTVAAFIGKRLGAMAALLVIVSFGVFSLVHLAPGTAIDAYLGTQPRTEARVADLTARYHLGEPFFTQYWLWVRDVLHFDFGTSSQSGGSVSEAISSRAGTSALLAVYAYLLAVLLGVVPGVIAALHRKKALDRGLVAGAVITFSTPPFVLGVLMLYLFAIVFPIFPAAGRGVGFTDQLWHLTLPALALALTVAAFLLRHTRAAVIGVLEQDYVQFARARGLDWRRILYGYALRNALIPVVTVSGALLAYFFTGAVLVESTFSINGLGTLLVSAAENRDVATIQGLSVLIAVLIVTANLLADLAYVAIDPRIRLGKGAS